MRLLLLSLICLPVVASAGLFDRGGSCDDGCAATCDDGCGSGCGSGCGHDGCRAGRGCGHGCGDCADNYRCKLETDVEDVEKDCFVVECEAVCVPPVSFDSLGCGSSKCMSCGHEGCGPTCDQCGCACDTGTPCCDAAAGCDNGCGAGCGSSGGGLKGLLSKLCAGPACGRVRMVNKLGTDSKPDGTRCTYEWSAEPACGGCGHCDRCGYDGCDTRCGHCPLD